jgi:hypothetical protein
MPQEVPGDGRIRDRREVSVHRARGNNPSEISAMTWTQERRQRSVSLTSTRHVSAACELVGQ